MTQMPYPNKKSKQTIGNHFVRGLNHLNYPLQHKCLVKEGIITYKTTHKPH